ncbi:DEAD/DEAH box helicase [Corynebacterium sp. 13CS0277]|uniref:DEAD/DEAH box helicase n=1 Tax=Corynebacterium sp. 13CS0277 TaxID=2071994 RepID=UPI000D047B34|nr:SNF2-related protein [Corynebacterium sp. 13CS0277]PRQ11967.1 DEAD/DEAH box helicase [Corynebacterium sp. 13CS0277]
MTALSRAELQTIIEAADFYMPVLTSANHMVYAIAHSEQPPLLHTVVRLPYASAQPPAAPADAEAGAAVPAATAADFPGDVDAAGAHAPGGQDATQVSASAAAAQAEQAPAELPVITLVDPGSIEWARDTYAGFLLAADAQSRQALVDVQHLLAGLPARRTLAAKALVSRVRALFSPPPAEALAEAQALREVFLQLRDGAYQSFQASQQLFQSAVALQESTGVALWEGDPRVPEEFVATARQRVLAAADCRDAEFRWIDADQLDALVAAVRAWDADPNSVVRLRAAAETALQALTQERVEVLLAQMPVEKLKDATSQRLRFSGLDAVGITTVAQVLAARVEDLTRVNGIGEATARRMKAAAQSLRAEAAARHATRIGHEPSPHAVELVGILHRYGQVLAQQPQDTARVQRLAGCARALPTAATLGAGDRLGQRRWLAFAENAGAHDPIDQLVDDLQWAQADPAIFAAARVLDPGPDVWEDYLRAPARYQSLLADLLRLDAEHVGFTDPDTIAAIRNLTLLRDYLTPDTFLRGYQAFGAKFAVVRRKTVLGDEMGLGKTIQAIAWAAHLAAADAGASHIVVVCPASVVLNWMRELAKFSTLPAVKAHGPDKEASRAQWVNQGGFLVCTFEGARALDLSAAETLIVDEAHLVKNPTARRSQAVAALIDQVDYALLLTGTPLENRVEEFTTLIRYVQPELLGRGATQMGAMAFARAIAPAYLRRNQVDVLDELPEKLEEDDIVELTAGDEAAYREAVASGSWMAMRRAAFLAGWQPPQDTAPDDPDRLDDPEGAAVEQDPGHAAAGRPAAAPAPSMPAKVERILDIVEEAESADRKVIVFTYFLDVLDVLQHYLGDRVVGTITGSVSAPQRQEMVDALGAAPAGAVLLAQITAGGVGLNIQAASVIVLAEPQVKPTIEDQAIARAFRMGQTRKVHVHRLIGADTVDERMLEILAPKRATFDSYARRSEVTSSTPDAVDITEPALAATIIAEERARLGFDAAAPIATEFGDVPAPAGVAAAPLGNTHTDTPKSAGTTGRPHNAEGTPGAEAPADTAPAETHHTAPQSTPAPPEENTP